ncbi:MAG TPA: gluconeogenesis factor YvcK family protein [Candidatus Dormibacteraeota bacterium]|nr:gluconeogenesis factor YvcK family protein [Candidatus Dormibacteraeota bacterium]
MIERTGKQYKWFLPGLNVKRWLLMAIVGGALLIDGMLRFLAAEGADFHINQSIDQIALGHVPLSWIDWIFMVSGAIFVVVGIRAWFRSIVAVITPNRKDHILEILVEKRALTRGAKIVAIGGGTGLATLLRGLKQYTSNITAVVTVSDDGGSSGRLRRELGVLPPGDIRNCLVALADSERLITELFQYRFTDGSGLAGHSFGNLLLAALTAVTGGFDTAIRESSRVLAIRGRVLPSTLTPVRLCAELEDRTIVEGETNISASTKRISRVFLDPLHCKPLPEVIDAIREADAIILGPGSLYTSIIPNLLVEGIAAEIARSNAVRVYVCNVMTQPGETHGYSAADHVQAINALVGERLFDYVIVNDAPPHRLRERYAAEGQEPVEPTVDELRALGLTPIVASVISEHEAVRHDSIRLASTIMTSIGEVLGSEPTRLPKADQTATSAFAE